MKKKIRKKTQKTGGTYCREVRSLGCVIEGDIGTFAILVSLLLLPCCHEVSSFAPQDAPP
jgi:hypothetical protein